MTLYTSTKWCLAYWRVGETTEEKVSSSITISFFFSWGSPYPFQQEAEPSKDMPAREFSPRTFRKLLIRWNLRISQTSETNVSQNDVWSSSSSCYLPRVLLFFFQALPYKSQDQAALKKHVECVEDQEYIRSQLSAANLVAFVRDEAVLPRASGADDRPMERSGVTLFKSPDSLRVEFNMPHAGK